MDVLLTVHSTAHVIDAYSASFEWRNKNKDYRYYVVVLRGELRECQAFNAYIIM